MDYSHRCYTCHVRCTLPPWNKAALRPDKRVAFGIELGRHFDPSRLAAEAQRAEALGFDLFSISDHLHTGQPTYGGQQQDDQIGLLEGVRSRFGHTYAGEPDRIAAELAADEAARAADTVLFTVPNQLGVDYNARILATIAEHIAPAIGWRPSAAPAVA